MLSDIIAPGRLRAGDPQALAALVAVAGWSVVVYCERAGADDEAARAVVLAFVTFRRRAIQAGDEAADDLERILLDSARDAVDEVRGEAPAGDEARRAEQAFARASPRPLSPQLATQTLRALVDAAPVDGDPAEVRATAERSYAAAYEAAKPAPAIAGEEELEPASALLLRAAQGTPPAPGPEPARAAAPPPDEPAAGTPRPPAAVQLAARLRALPPAQRAVAFAGALLFLAVLVALLSGGDDPVPGDSAVTAPPVTMTVTQTVTVPAAASAGRSEILRGRTRRPFSAGGARFEVVPITGARWAREVRGDAPRRGTRWRTMAVRSRNAGRRDLVLRTLGYRLRTGQGRIVGPRVVEVADGPRQARTGRLPVGSRASVHLGFEAPTGARGLSLLFEPSGLDGPTATVPIPG